MGTKDQDMDELPIRHVKLKPKQFNGSLLGPMQNLLETDSPVHESFSRSIPYTSTELEKSSKSFTSDEKISTNAFHKQLKSLGSLINHNRNREDTSSSDEKDDSPSSELLSNSSTTQHYQTGSPPDQDTESDENSDEYISDATASEVEFLDALTTAIVDSEMETDSEVKDKNNPALVRIESKKFSSERKEERKDSTLLRSKNSFMRNDKDETEQVPTKSVAGTEAATAPFSDGDGGKSIHETESHYRTISFNKVVSKKVSDEEYEFNPATTNENGAKPKAKLEKDSFSHSLRHMAKQLLELKHELTEDEEEVDSQDPEENEDELLVDNAGVQESGIVEKDEYLVENVQTNNVTEVCNDLIAKDTETIQTEINSIATCLGEDQADLTSRENELHGLQNIESIKIEQLNTNKEFGDHEVHVSSDVMKDSEKADEISIDGTVTKNITMDRVSNYEMPEFENLHPTKMEELESGENLHVDETSVEENSEETDETLMDGMMADNLTRELHESEMAETQNLTLVDKEQDFVESEAYLGPCGMQHGEESYEIHGHGTVTKRSIKEEVFYNEMPDNQNLSSEGEELCESEMQHAKNETEKLINEEVFDGDVSETENTNSNEKELYESEMYVGLDGQTAETYELPVDGREIGKLIEAEDFDSGIAVFQIVNSIKNEEEFLENEMDVSSDDLQHGKEPYEIPTVSTIDENLDSEDALREISLQEQNVYHGDATQIPGSEYSLDEERTLSDNSAEPWDSHVDDGLSVKALGDRYELLEEEIQDTDIEPVSSRPLIKDNILREALLGSNEPLEEEEDGDKVDDRGGELPVPQVVGAAAEDESVNPVPEDPVTVLGTDIQDEAVTPVACNPEVISAPVDPVTDLETEILHEVVTTIACNSEIIPYRAIISPPIQSIAPTFNSVPGEGDIVPPLPPLPPIQWRMGKPQMGPLPSLGPMAPPAHSSKFVPLPNFSKLGRPPRPKSSKVAAKERKLHEVENEQIGENCEMIFNTEELQNCLMSPSLEKDTSTKGFASVENNPICNETIVRYEESPVRELSVKEEPLSSGDGNFEQEMKEEEPRKKPPTVPIPPKYPMFQVTSHDNSMVWTIFLSPSHKFFQFS